MWRLDPCFPAPANVKIMYLVSTRDIKAGEVIMKDLPLVLGPKQRTLPVCLGCHKTLRGCEVFNCTGCKFPLCAPSCQTSKYHKSECEVLAKSKGRLTIANFDNPSPAYECVAPLRCLLTQKTDPKKWETLKTMQSHAEEIRKTELYQVNQNNTEKFLRIFLGCEDLDADVIHEMCGILLTNAFDVVHNGTRVRALYYLPAMMAHDCKPNTKHVIDDDLTMTVRATVAIPKNEAITATYTQTLWHTISRRQHLKATKFFLCSCARCRDPTELGTNLSTILCSECQEGHITSVDPMDLESDWRCAKCQFVISSKALRWGDNALFKELRDMEQGVALTLEQFLQRYKGALHKNHRFFIEAKYALVKYYGNYPDYKYYELTETQLQNKVEWCKELLKLADVIDPGKSLLRGTLLFELQAGVTALAKYRLSNDIITQEKAQEAMKEAVEYLREGSEILKHEPEMEKGGLAQRLKTLAQELDL
ncbi:SET domain-containing protein SmydA-8-like isoform X2 [Oratosquilla oratoria]|uniref:SET domain-containing protein SmydA-8-like isoform X2 n=1 Tax=Oratosquilla oratoria TaxID=337810 RepID=UPI003F7767E6